MNSYFTTLLILGACIATTNCLTCRKCPIGVFGTCLFPSEVTCQNSTASCFNGEAQFNATGVLKLQISGCLDSDLCNKTVTGTLLGAGYTSSFKCCSTNLCNAASPLQLSLIAAILAALLSSVWAM